MQHELQVLELDGATWRPVWQRGSVIPIEWGLSYLEAGHPAIRTVDVAGLETDRVTRTDAQSLIDATKRSSQKEVEKAI